MRWSSPYGLDLTALINTYILEWERDAGAHGPHMLMNRQRLDELGDLRR